MLELCNLGASILAFKNAGNKDFIVGNKKPVLPHSITNYPYFGHTIGLLAGRTSTVPFTVANKTYTVEESENPWVSLHGGPQSRALSFQIWDAKPLQHEEFGGTIFSIAAEAYDTVAIITCLIALAKKSNTIRIEYLVESAKPFPVNLTNHSYFNLGSSTVLDYKLQIPSSALYQLNEQGLCTGKRIDISKTALDLRSPLRLADAINATKGGQGLDHLFHLDSNSENYSCTQILTGKKLSLHLAATVEAELASLQAYTSTPALLCYTGNFLDTYTEGERQFIRHEALCLETQYPSGFTHNAKLAQSYADTQKPWTECTEYQFTDG